MPGEKTSHSILEEQRALEKRKREKITLDHEQMIATERNTYEEKKEGVLANTGKKVMAGAGGILTGSLLLVFMAGPIGIGVGLGLLMLGSIPAVFAGNDQLPGRDAFLAERAGVARVKESGQR